MKNIFLLTAAAATLGVPLTAYSQNHLGDPSVIIERGALDDIKWTISETGLFTMSRSGEQPTGGNVNSNSIVIADYKIFYPWYQHRDLIKSVVIGAGVTTIGYHYFQECTNLERVTFLENVTEISGEAFSGCTRLSAITLPESVTHIGRDAFERCTSLREINIPAGVTELESNAFYGCTGLEKIVVSDKNPKLMAQGTVLFSKDGRELIQCYPNEEQTSYVIPSGVTKIGDNAFYGCSKLTKITIPAGVTAIGDNAFFLCKGLVSIVIPESVVSIGEGCFDACARLTNITIPAGVRKIDVSTFSGCHNLASITIPKGVTEIGRSAFFYCMGLANVTCLAVVPPKVVDNSFYKNAPNNVLHVPAGSVAAYKAKVAWRTAFSSIVALP